MLTKNFFLRPLRWIYSTQRPILLTFGFLVLVYITKKSAPYFIDDSTWYKNPVISFLGVVKWMAFIVFLLSIISKIPYAGTPLITLGMTAVLLIGVEAACLVLYEYDHRPKTEKELADENKENSESGWFKKFAALFENKKKEDKKAEPIPDAPPTTISAEALGVEVVPENFEQLKVVDQPIFRKEDPVYNEWQMPDKEMGYANKLDSRVEIKSWSFGIQNPNAFYTCDSLGRRVTGNDYKSSRKKYALFFGCSVSFGVLVDDRQTLPSILERLDTNYRSYNYGVTGYGTHHLYALLHNRNLKKEVTETDGAAFYIYFYGHVNRAIGDMDSYIYWNSESPYYYLDGDKIVHNGNFKDGRKLVSKFYTFFSTTYVCKYFDIHLPGKLREHQFRFAAKLIEESYKEYQRQFGNEKFYVLFLPGWGNELKPYLDELKIKYLDYDRLLLYWQDKYHFSGDGHPRPLLYKILAEQIEKDVLSKH